jgi:protease-4
MKKTLVVLFVVLALLSLLALTAIGLIASLGEDTQSVESGSVLTIDLSQPVTELGTEPGIESLLAGGGGMPLAARELAQAIERAADDDRIEAVLLHGGVTGSTAALDALRDAVMRVRKADKPVVAYYGSLDERTLWFASAADEVWMEPMGMVLIDGFSIEIPYFGDMLAKYGIEVQVTRVGKYKSAVEPFMRSSMSAENREQLSGMLTDIEATIYSDIAKARGTTLEELQSAAKRDGLVTSSDALARKWVTKLGSFGEALAHMKSLVGVDPDEALPQVDLVRYAKTTRKKQPKGRVIELVQAQGEIVDGSSSTGIGGDDLAARLRAVRMDDDVAAVVLRVDSPGGSATASEAIRQEILALRSMGKPVVVSMGAVAASGGYWISANANKIVAHPETITGSIGVFGMLPNVEKFALEHGVRSESVSTSELAGWDSLMRRKTAAQLERVQLHVDDIYERFLVLVADGRQLDKAKVAEIAQGRVWSGVQAKELGLVDELGGLEEAIALARKEADLPDSAGVRVQRKQLDWIDQLVEDLIDERRPDLARMEQTPAMQAARMLARVQALAGNTGVVARLPFDPDVR